MGRGRALSHPTALLEMMMMTISPRLANAQHWQRLAVTAVVAMGGALRRSLRASEPKETKGAQRETVSTKHFPIAALTTRRTKKRTVVLRRGASGKNESGA